MQDKSENAAASKKSRAALITIYDAEALGARYIHAGLVGAGYPCDLVLFRDRKENYQFLNKPEPVSFYPDDAEFELLRELFTDRRPRVVGISFRSLNLEIAQRITRVAREAIDPLIVWGGNHPTLLPDECIEEADVVCIGEGEGAMLELMDAIDRDRPIHEIKNLWVTKAGEVIKNPLRPLIHDLDALPFPICGNKDKFTIEENAIQARDIYLGSDSPIIYNIMGSRGCPYNCAFCTNSSFRKTFKGLGKYARNRSPENVIEELEQAIGQIRVKAVAFQDEVFGLDMEWGLALCALYKEKIRLPFKNTLHSKMVNPKLVEAMKDTGIYHIHLGIQSGSEKSRRQNYNRIQGNEDILAAAREFNKNKIITTYDFIFDNPFEDQKDLENTLELMLGLPRPHNFNIFSLCYFISTQITDRALADGKITPDQIDHFSGKSRARFWANFYDSIDRKNSFYITLAWMEVIKFNYTQMKLVFFSFDYQTSFHVFPRWLIRRLSRSGFVGRRPWILHHALRIGVGAINLALAPARGVRAALGRLRRGRWGELGRRIRVRFSRSGT